MIIIQLTQGHYRDITGTPKDEALATFAKDDADFLAKHPTCAKYHRPCWRELEVVEGKTAPWGHEWYVVDEAGLLQMHSAHYDSSG